MGFDIVTKSQGGGRRPCSPVRVRGDGHIIIAADVAAQVDMQRGDRVLFLSGNGPDTGRWSIEKAAKGYVLFRPAKTSKDLMTACRALSKAIGRPQLRTIGVEYEIVGKRLIITLPKQSSLQAAE